MSRCTRSARVGGFGLTWWAIASTAIAGPVKLGFDAEPAGRSHVPTQVGFASSASMPFVAQSSPRSDSQAGATWLDYVPESPELGDAAPAVVFSQQRNQVLSIPILPLGVLGLAGLSGGLIFVGTRVLGLRRP